MADPIDPYLRPTDAFIWYLERDPRLRWTISAVFVLDHAPAFDAVTKRFERASRLDPRFRSRLAGPPLRLGSPRWVADRSFDLRYHVRHVVAAPPGRLDDVLDLACSTAMGGLDHTRPLWQATLIDGLEGGRAALAVKLNHALTDGIGGLQVAQHLFDLEAEPGLLAEAPPPAEPERVDAVALLRRAFERNTRTSMRVMARLARAVPQTLRDLWTDPRGAISSAGRTAGSVASTLRPFSDTKSPVMQGRGMSWRYAALEVGSDALYRAGHAAGGSLNDAFMAGITGGLRRYHDHHGAMPEALRVSLPISIRQPDDPPGGNRVIILRYEVPVAEADVTERVRRLHEATTVARNEPVVPYAEAVFGSLNPLTPWVIAPMALHVDFVASNVPGYRTPVYLEGAEVLRCYPFGPTGGTAVNITLMSYRDTCGVGVNMDTAAIPDPDVFLRCLADGFDEVLDLVGEHRPTVVGTTALRSPSSEPAPLAA